MKKIILIATIILSIFISLTIYNKQYAIFNGVDYISKYHAGNEEMFLNFLTKISTNEKSKVLLTIFTDEGDPIYYSIEYNGDYFELVMDTRQDSNGPKEVYKYKYLSIEARIEETNDVTIHYYVLVNDTDEFSLKYLINGR